MPEHRKNATSDGVEVMRAAAVDKFGPPSELSIHELPVPTPSPLEVLIALEWAGVGGWDASIRNGSWKSPGKPRFPLVPGVDGAGTVVATGTRVRRLQCGDRVYAYEFGNRKGGFYAQYAVARARHVDRIPETLGSREAAAILTTGLTAMQGLNLLRLRRGSTILIFGASGAVGTMAVQIAKERRATVIATASGRAATRVVRRLGADIVIDARSSIGVEQVRAATPRGLSAIFALAGGPELEQLIGSMRKGGRVVHPNGVEPEPKRRPGVRIRGFDVVADPRQFKQFCKYIEAGSLEAEVAAEYPLSQAAQAHRRLAHGQVVGRIVLCIRRSSK